MLAQHALNPHVEIGVDNDVRRGGNIVGDVGAGSLPGAERELVRDEVMFAVEDRLPAEV